MSAFNGVIPVLNLSEFNVWRARSSRLSSAIARVRVSALSVLINRDLPLLTVVEYFTREPVCRLDLNVRFANMTHEKREGLRQYSRSRFSLSEA